MHCSVFKKTTDEWHPNHYGELVEVTFCQTGPSPPTVGEWRVCVWGNDDCGMEKDFNNENEAWCCFLEVIGFDSVDMLNLISIGFVSA